jgi:hypothetical protein
MSPTKYESVRLTPAKAALADLSQEDIRRFFYQTQTSSEFQAPAVTEDALWENFLSIHMIGRRDSKYMKYQYKQAPLCQRTLCEHTRAYHPHDISDHAVTGQLANEIKLKQGVGRSKVKVPFAGVTKYADDYKKYSREQARGAKRPSAKPVYPTNDFGIPYHPLLGSEKLEETVSHEHKQFRAHPLELAKAEKAKPPKANLRLVDHLVPQTTAYREEFFSEKGCPRRPLRKPVRCKSAPATRGPVEALPNWMRQNAAEGKGWAESRVVPRLPEKSGAGADSTAGSQLQKTGARPRSASAGSLRQVVNNQTVDLQVRGSAPTSLEQQKQQPPGSRVRPPSAGPTRQPSVGRVRPPSASAGELGNRAAATSSQAAAPQRPVSAARMRPRPPSASRAQASMSEVDATMRAVRPASAGVLRSNASATQQ